MLLDRKDTFNDGSRALCIARPSMHILERIGAVKPFLDKALGWRFGRSYYRGEQIFRLEMPHPPRARNTCRCIICSSNISSSICTTRSPPAT